MTVKKIERRFFHELRAESQGDEMALVGYAAKFNTQSEDLGGFRETIMPGAFTRSLRAGGDVKCLYNHDPNFVLGRTKNKTLSLEEDGVGLRFRCVLPNTQAARDLHTLIGRGDVDSCSFAFMPVSQSWEDARDGNGDMYASRKLMDVDLQDVSAVTYPAYPDTQVSARSLAMFPDGEPLEVRSAIDRVKRSKEAMLPTQGGESAKTKEAHRAAAKMHEQHGHYHNGMSGDHDQEYTELMRAGDMKGAGQHTMAAAAHRCAMRSHFDAASDHRMAHESTNEMTSAMARMSSGMANECSRCADGCSDKAPGFRSSPELSERRTAAFAKAEKRASEQSVPDLTAISLPQPFDSDMKKAWWDAFMESYQDAVHNRKLRNQEALSWGIAEANKKVQPPTEVRPEVAGQGKNPSEVPHDVVPTSGAAAEITAPAANEEQNRGRGVVLEFRYSEGTYEDCIADINQALCDKYGYMPNNYGWCRFWVVETFEDHVIVCSNDGALGGSQKYFSMPYEYDPKAEPGKQVTLGEMTPVEQEYVPSERALAVGLERSKRGKYKFEKPSDAPDHVAEDKKAQWIAVWNSAYKKAKEDGKSEDDANSSAFAQANGVAGKSEKKSADGGDDCSCACPQCKNGNCADCSNDDCDDPNCDDLFEMSEDDEDRSSKKPYGDVAYADPGYQSDKKKRYPIDTSEHIHAAWNYINKKKNAGKYSADDLGKIKAKIIAAWKEKIDKDGPPSAEKKAFDLEMEQRLAYARLIELEIDVDRDSLS